MSEKDLLILTCSSEKEGLSLAMEEIASELEGLEEDLIKFNHSSEE